MNKKSQLYLLHYFIRYSFIHVIFYSFFKKTYLNTSTRCQATSTWLHFPFCVIMLTSRSLAIALWLKVFVWFMITHHKWSVRLHLKVGKLGAKCFVSMTIFYFTYARFSLLNKLSRNCFASLETKIFSIKFLNEFMLDASTARWCGFPTFPHENAVVCWFGYIILQAELMTDRIIPPLCFTDEKPNQTGPSPFSNSSILLTCLYFRLLPLPLHTVSYICIQAEGGEME